MLEVKPNHVAVIPLYDPEQTKSGLHIPVTAQTRSDQGIVKYAGKNCKWLKAGDWVLFSGWSGDVVLLEGEGKLIFLPEHQVLGVIHTEAEPVGGLYMQESDGSYIKATWESVLDILAANAEHLKTKYRMTTNPRYYREREQWMRNNSEAYNLAIEDEDE